MANHKSAIKEHRQSLKRRDRNRFARSQMRTSVKQLRAAISAGEASKATEMLPGVLSLIDRTARKGAIEKKAASRYKSRLTKAANTTAAG